MKSIRGKKQFKILIFVLIAVITLGIGYAVFSEISLLINGAASATTGGLTQPKYIYTINPYDIYSDTEITDQISVFNDFSIAKTEYGHPFALAHLLENNRITESYVAFEKNNTVYYLKGRINEENEESQPVYEANVDVLKEAFGPDWGSACTYNSSWFTCDADGLRAEAYENGSVHASESDWFCLVHYEGGARCYY